MLADKPEGTKHKLLSGGKYPTALLAIARNDTVDKHQSCAKRNVRIRLAYYSQPSPLRQQQ